jgi:hypothetical protein
LRRRSKFHGDQSIANRIVWLESFRDEALAVVRLVGCNARILDVLRSASTDGPVRRQTGIAYLVK